MTAKELIAELEKHPGDTPIVVLDHEGDADSVNEVEETQAHTYSDKFLDLHFGGCCPKRPRFKALQIC